MDLLVTDTLDAEVISWLESRLSVRYAPELAGRAREFRRSLFNVRAVIVSASTSIDAETLDFAPLLCAVGRVNAGSENIDLAACERHNVEIVRSVMATARAEAEFAIGAMLSLLRRVPVRGGDGVLAGRELGDATIGLVGMTPAARSIAQLLGSFGPRIIGYDPSLHASDSVWPQWRVAHAGLRELVERSDVLCVQLDYFSRYHGLLGDRFLALVQARPGGGMHRPLGVVRRAVAGRGDEERPHRGRLVRQHGAGCPRRGQAAARHREPSGDAARVLPHPRGAPAQRLGGGAPAGGAARDSAARQRQRPLHADGARRSR